MLETVASVVCVVRSFNPIVNHICQKRGRKKQPENEINRGIVLGF
jgi:hypothetical protein